MNYYVTNGERNRLIPSGEPVPEGWWLGTTDIVAKAQDVSAKTDPKPKEVEVSEPEAITRFYINDGEINRLHDSSNPIPEGWEVGRLTKDHS